MAREQLSAGHAPYGFRSASAVREEEAVGHLCGRLEAAFDGSDLTGELLEPIASFIGAETASLRLTASSRPRAIPRPIATLGIPSAVGDAYRERFHEFDPARRLPRRAATGPIFADPDRPGQWVGVEISPAHTQRLRGEFREYRRGFLEPNDFVHHVGFYFNDELGRTLLFDFHRGRRASPFDALETARAWVAGRFLYARIAKRWNPIMPAVASAALEDSLSTREFEVAAAVAQGLSNKEVAAALKISVRTIENHMRSIFAKLGVGSRTQLSAVFYRLSAGDKR